MKQSQFWEADSGSDGQDIFRLYKTRRSIAVFTAVCHWALFRSGSSYPISLIFIWILISHLSQRVKSLLYPSCFLTKEKKRYVKYSNVNFICIIYTVILTSVRYLRGCPLDGDSLYIRLRLRYWSPPLTSTSRVLLINITICQDLKCVRLVHI
jgi:hypothetical protein